MCLVKLADLRADRPAMLAAPAIRTASGLRHRVTRIISRRPSLSQAASRILTALVVCALCAVSLSAGALTVVDVRELPLPLQVIRMAPELHTAPPAIASLITQPEPPPRSETLASLKPSDRPAPSGALDTEPREERDAVPAAPVTAPAAADTHAVPASTDGPAPASIESPTTADVPAATTPASEASAAMPWTRAADLGVAVGHRSSAAGVATGSAFRHFAKRIAGAF
jgi:hypothetical protein